MTPINFNVEKINFKKYMKEIFRSAAYYLGPINLVLWVAMTMIFANNLRDAVCVMIGCIAWFIQIVINYEAIKLKQQNFNRAVKLALITSFVANLIFSLITYFTDKSFWSLGAYCIGGSVTFLIVTAFNTKKA